MNKLRFFNMEIMMSLRTKFYLASACLILTVVVGMMLTLYSVEKNQLWQDIQREQESDLSKFASVCEQNLLTEDELPIINYASTLVVAPMVSFTGYVDSNGHGWNYDRLEKGLPLDFNEEGLRKILASNGFLTQDISRHGEEIRLVSKPVKGGKFVWVGYSKKVINQIFKQRIDSKIARFRIVGLIAILFGLGLAQLMAARLSKPVQLLMKAAEDIGKGQKNVAVPVESSDELGRLTKTFNHMSQELEKLDQLKDDFMSHVTHELRSPLTSIIATVELMAEMPLMEKDPKFKRSVDRLSYGSERLNKLIDNILDLTKIQAGKMVFDIQPVSLPIILSEMADFFVPRAMEKGLEIKANVPSTFPLAMADPERIRQVLSNLIHNAIKFTNQGKITLWVREKNGMAEVGVQDTGVGIPKEFIQRVFEKFECLQDTKARVDKVVPGSGLGLNIVMNSIQAQSGTVRVESEVGQGSTFIFTLPLASAEIQEKYLLKSIQNETAPVLTKVDQRQAIILNGKRA